MELSKLDARITHDSLSDDSSTNFCAIQSTEAAKRSEVMREDQTASVREHEVDEVDTELDDKEVGEKAVRGNSFKCHIVGLAQP